MAKATEDNSAPLEQFEPLPRRILVVYLPLVVFVSIKTSQHDEAWLEAFKKASALPEVVEFYRMSGEVDYLLKVLVKDIAAYDRFYRRLIAIAPLCDVSSSFAMEQIKFTTAVPVQGGAT